MVERRSLLLDSPKCLSKMTRFGSFVQLVGEKDHVQQS